MTQDSPAHGELSVAELAAMLRGGEAPFLLDVREPDEFAGGALPASVNVPLGELPQRLDEVPAERLVVAICRSGMRSATAAAFLAGHGRTVLNLTGGVLAWADLERG